MKILNETLTAYLDGELSASEISHVEAQLSKSPELAARLDKMRKTDELLSQTYHRIDQRPMPTDVLDMLADFPEKQAKDQTATILPFEIFKKRPSIVASPIWKVAMAASVMLFVGLGVGRGLMTQTALPDLKATHISPDNALFAILDTQPSLSTASFDDDTIIRPLMTFRSTDDTYCREFEIITPETGSRSVACRTENSWMVKVTTKTRNNLSTGNGLYQTASQPESALLDSTILELMAGDALSADQEANIIEEKWHQK